MIPFLIFLLAGFQTNVAPNDSCFFTKSLWFVQAYGRTEVSYAKIDKQIKSKLALAMARGRELSPEDVKDWVSPEIFRKVAGKDDRISDADLTRALASMVPETRKKLAPELREYADYLTTTFDMIEPEHHASMDQLSDWIAKNWQPSSTLHVISTCTGNSRRSILGATMGNLAATYYGLDNVRFHSGGTTPSAFNKRTINTLKEIGFRVEPTGEEAERGDPSLPNDIFTVAWGEGMECLEFSKTYNDPSNPSSGFAAILVCNEADTDCPVLPGAALRVSMIFLDPKSYDDGPYESKKYAERRDDICRTLLAIMANARRKIQGTIQDSGN